MKRRRGFALAWELGLPTERNRAALYRQIRTEVTRVCQEARCRPVLIVDEAHHLRSEVFEDLRLLTNDAMDSDNRLGVLFVGHPELRRAGTEMPLFEPAALEAVFQATSGLPRKVNLLAHHALMAAALTRAKTVSIEHVQAALPEVA